MLTIHRLNKPEERNLNCIFALVLWKDMENTHHNPMLNLVLQIKLIIYIHLKGCDPEKTMMPLCATTGSASKQETYMEESTTARYWTGENKYQRAWVIEPDLQDCPQLNPHSPWLRFGLVDAGNQSMIMSPHICIQLAWCNRHLEY